MLSIFGVSYPDVNDGSSLVETGIEINFQYVIEHLLLRM